MALTALVDLSIGAVHLVQTPDVLVRGLLGGRGMNMAYLYSLLSPGIDPLGPENVLIFGCGLLTGYPVPNGSRMNITAKSPESFTFGDANMGGFFPAWMRKSGFDRLIISGRAPEPVFLHLAEGGVRVRSAAAYWGMNVAETQKALEQDLGKGIRSAVIGPAGEHLVRFAVITNGKKNTAGRGGLGAVMGSKNLKAVVATGDQELQIAHRTELLTLRKELTDYLQASKVIQILGKLGTPFMYEAGNRIGHMRTKNSQLNQWSSSLNASHVEEYVERMAACWGCSVHCRHVNRFGGEGPEFVSIALLGANSCVEDMAEVIKLNNLCNDLGLDISSAGTVIPWAMELYQRRIIGDEITGGPIQWGDVERMKGLLMDIAMRRGFGDVLAESTQAVRLGKLPPEAAEYLIQAKGLPQSDGLDVRFIKSFALGFATSSRGADHLRSRPTIDVLSLADEVRYKVCGADTKADPNAYETKEIMVESSEDIYAVADCLGICRFVCRGWNSPKLLGYEHFAELVRLALGLEFLPSELRGAGRRVLDLERIISSREGLGRADDTLPRRYLEEPMPMGGTKGARIDKDEFNRMLTRYYLRRGWDEMGHVSPDRQTELDELAQEAIG